MAHELTIRKSGKAEMAYVGETPWHGLGEKLEEGASIDKWRIAAGMDWEVHKAKALYMPAMGAVTGIKHLEVPEKQVLYRSDTQDALGIVSNKYKPVQPGEVLEFFADLTDQAGFKLHTAGTLFGGRRLWALAHIGDTATIVGKKDKVGGYLLLSTSCDGSLATTARFTTVRVVCNNTLSMATAKSKGKAEVSIRHVSVFDAAAVKDKLGIAHDQFGTWVEAAKQLAKIELKQDQAQEIIIELLQDTKQIFSKDPEKAKPVCQIIDLFSGKAMGSDLAGQTAWGLLNAVTEYVDHHARATDSSNRLSSAWFGRGDMVKTETMNHLLKLAA